MLGSEEQGIIDLIQQMRLDQDIRANLQEFRLKLVSF